MAEAGQPYLRTSSALVHGGDDLLGDGGTVPGAGPARGDHGADLFRVAGKERLPDSRPYRLRTAPRRYCAGVRRSDHFTGDASTCAIAQSAAGRAIEPLIMCGIAGCIQRASDPRDARAIVERMTARLAHRGPDGAGLWQ